jgi:hypothetical protein
MLTFKGMGEKAEEQQNKHSANSQCKRKKKFI